MRCLEGALIILFLLPCNPLGELIESRPVLDRVPDQSFVLKGPVGRSKQFIASRSITGAYAFAYLPEGGVVSVSLRVLAGPEFKAGWYSPREGDFYAVNEKIEGNEHNFTSLSSGRGQDWVLVLDSIVTG